VLFPESDVEKLGGSFSDNIKHGIEFFLEVIKLRNHIAMPDFKLIILKRYFLQSRLSIDKIVGFVILDSTIRTRPSVSKGVVDGVENIF